ncbi:MAG: glycoside hydrolase family 2, partial [Bacteroidales bacterium]|nr:glycoside hydrolase family 2 [Bacteroidales bacterium]
ITYKLLVLPDIKTMRPQVLGKIEELVKAGGTVLGPRPNRSPSLENYPECDKQVNQIADRLWGENYEEGKLVREYGQGYLMAGTGIREVFEEIGVEKDVDLQDEVPVLWTHRTLPGMEIYFLTNQSTEEPVNISPSFRVEGLKPQLWNPVNGAMRSLNDYTRKDGRTTVPIELKAKESMFVVFTNQRNENVDAGYAGNFPEPQTLQTLQGEWKVDFKNKDIAPREPMVWNQLKDWTESENDQIQYYSGTATYTTQFTVEAIPENSNLFLDLGDVGVMARAKLNGRNLGGVWIDPFILPANGHLKEGENKLEIEVVNTWRNRMVKDESLPEDEQYTWTVVNDIEPGEELMSSGLIGPVSFRMISTTSD